MSIVSLPRAGANGRLSLAVPSKGRMSQPALELCAAAGLAFEVSERALVVPCSNAPVDLLLVRADDIPEYVQDGVVDGGITGANLVVEHGADVVELSPLGFGRCRLDAAVPDDSAWQRVEDLAGLRIATSHPVTTILKFRELGVEVEVVEVSGSVEVAPRLGLADAIVDLVSTGSTLAANGLRTVGTLLSSQATLIGRREPREGREELLGRLELMLSGVVAARRRRYLMMNAPEAQLATIRAVLPGMGSPTVLPLADDGMIAIHAAVDVDQVWDLLPRLKELGASSILVVPVERLLP
jgi:ATP phosphoribosyltransferase